MIYKQTDCEVQQGSFPCFPVPMFCDVDVTLFLDTT